MSGRWYPFSVSGSQSARAARLRKLAFGADLGVTVTRWGTSRQQVSEFTLLSGTARAYYTLANTPVRNPTGDQDFSLRVDLFTGRAGRQFRGDIRKAADLIRQALGVRKYTFVGWDTGVQASANALRFSATWSSYQGHIRGLSNGQLLLGVGFSNAFRFSKQAHD